MPTITQDIRPYDVVAERNRCPDPSAGGAIPWTVHANATTSISSDWGSAGSTSFKAVAGSSSLSAMRTPNLDRPAVVGGSTVLIGLDLYNGAGGSRSFTVTIRFYDAPGANVFGAGGSATLGSQVGSDTSQTFTVASSAVQQVSFTAVVPAGATSFAVIVIRNIGTGAATNDPYYVDRVTYAINRTSSFNQAANGVTGFFSGSTADNVGTAFEWVGATNASTSVAYQRNSNTDPVDPLQILSYKVTRDVRSITHDIINVAAVEVTLSPAGLRKGTIEYLFADAALLARAENIHSQGVSTITLSGAPYFGTMKYVPADTVVTELDIDTGVFKLITGFQEVA